VKTELGQGIPLKIDSSARKMVLAIAPLCILISGCATTRYAPTYCLASDQHLPAEPPKIKDQLTGDASKDVGTLAGSAIRLRAWGEGLRTILEGCREPSR
jgi:hypothetical protein